NHRNDEKHWWVQAEAMVGFLNAFELSKNQVFFELFDKIWNYTKKQIVDHQNGEWFWGRNADGSLMAKQDKAGLWKCPYHNSRACMEIISRLKHLQED
ncbi:MAG: N-acyl-D-glucosamine 2-epimerase, partial [Chryseobacterium sp.]